jgi:hypothetical protein
MFDKSSSLEIRCDAPAYSIVQACRMVGIQNPEDVRWCRLSQLREGQARQLELFKPHTWKAFWEMQEPAGSCCSCGQGIPRLEQITFTYLSGKAVNYFVGQCPRCRTVFWEPG